jgi:F0F1-type ATP synthase assembly protein I
VGQLLTVVRFEKVAKRGQPMKDAGYGELTRYLGLVTQVGLTMLVSIGVGFGIGWFLDHKLATGGLFLIIFILLGVGAGFWSVYRLIMKA